MGPPLPSCDPCPHLPPPQPWPRPPAIQYLLLQANLSDQILRGQVRKWPASALPSAPLPLPCTLASAPGSTASRLWPGGPSCPLCPHPLRRPQGWGTVIGKFRNSACSPFSDLVPDHSLMVSVEVFVFAFSSSCVFLLSLPPHTPLGAEFLEDTPSSHLSAPAPAQLSPKWYHLVSRTPPLIILPYLPHLLSHLLPSPSCLPSTLPWLSLSSRSSIPLPEPPPSLSLCSVPPFRPLYSSSPPPVQPPTFSSPFPPLLLPPSFIPASPPSLPCVHPSCLPLLCLWPIPACPAHPGPPQRPPGACGPACPLPEVTGREAGAPAPQRAPAPQPALLNTGAYLLSFLLLFLLSCCFLQAVSFRYDEMRHEHFHSNSH